MNSEYADNVDVNSESAVVASIDIHNIITCSPIKWYTSNSGSVECGRDLTQKFHPELTSS